MAWKPPDYGHENAPRAFRHEGLREICGVLSTPAGIIARRYEILSCTFASLRETCRTEYPVAIDTCVSV